MFKAIIVEDEQPCCVIVKRDVNKRYLNDLLSPLGERPSNEGLGGYNAIAKTQLLARSSCQ